MMQPTEQQVKIKHQPSKQKFTY